MKRNVLVLLLSSLVLVFTIGLLGGCQSGASSQENKSISIQGSDTMVNLGQNLAETYMGNVDKEAQLAVTGGGSGTGIAAMINDNTDIAQSSRAMKTEELENAESNGVTALEFIVAQDGLAVVVNPANPIDQLTVQEIKAIFTGAVSDWSELGWDDGGTITLYSRQSNSGTYVYFNERIMDGEDWAADTMFMPGSAAISEGIEADTSAIGYFGVGYVKDVTNKALKVARSTNDPYVTPLERENVDTGLYPIARPLFFYTNGIPQGVVLEYLNWVLSPDGQKSVGDSGFYRITPEYVAMNEATFKAAGVE